MFFQSPPEELVKHRRYPEGLRQDELLLSKVGAFPWKSIDRQDPEVQKLPFLVQQLHEP